MESRTSNHQHVGKIRVPNSWLQRVEANTRQHCTGSAGAASPLIQQLDSDFLSSLITSVSKEVAVAAWSRTALHALRSRDLRAWQQRHAAEGPELDDGVEMAVEMARLHARTAALRLKDDALSRPVLSFADLLSQQRRAMDAHSVTGPHKSTAAMLLQSVKLRTLAEQMLQVTASFRACTTDEQHLRAHKDKHNHSSWPLPLQGPGLHDLLLRMDLSATLYTLMRHHMQSPDLHQGSDPGLEPEQVNQDMAATDIGLIPCSFMPQPQHQEDTQRNFAAWNSSEHPSQKVASSAVPGRPTGGVLPGSAEFLEETGTEPLNSVSEMLHRIKVSDGQVMQMLQESRELRVLASSMCQGQASSILTAQALGTSFDLSAIHSKITSNK